MPPTLVLTRPDAAGRRFLAQVQAALGRPVDHVLAPVLDIRPLTPPLSAVLPAALILSSEPGARAARRLGLAPGLPVLAVGRQTAGVAGDLGFSPVLVARDADDLVARAAEVDLPGPWLHLRGAHARGDIASRLRALGRAVDERIVYDQVPVPLTSAARAVLQGQNPVILPLFSPRSAHILAGQGPFAAPVHLVAISRAAQEAAASLPAQSRAMAEAPDGAAMTEAVVRLWRGLASLEAPPASG